MQGRGKQRATEEPKGPKYPACLVYGPSVHSKRLGGTQPRATHGQNRGSEERFYIGNDRETLYGCREAANSEPRRNANAASVPHLSVTVRPYTLNCREERSLGKC